MPMWPRRRTGWNAGAQSMGEGKEHRLIQAAGGLVWRPGSGGPDVALVHRPRYDDWSFPKGKREPGEHVLRTAVREVREETGFQVVLGRPLGRSVYPVAAGTKDVSYWAARYVEPSGFARGAEVDDVRWVPADMAHERLTYERDVELLGEFRSAPADTAPLILLRHAAAGRKAGVVSKNQVAADLARPLDAEGISTAQALADVLACYGRCRVISSAAERCLATVRPYARLVGAPVEVEPALTVTPDPLYAASMLIAGSGPEWADVADRQAGVPDGMTRSPGRRPEVEVNAGLLEQSARRRVGDLVRSGAPTLICAHRENLPALIDAAFRALGATPPGNEPLGKGEFWALHSACGQILSAERHDPGK